MATGRLCAIAILASFELCAQKPENVMVVVNTESALSKSIGEYYVSRRHIPLANVCRIHVSVNELIPRADYDKQIALPVAACLKGKNLIESVLYIVTTAGVPLRVDGTVEGPSMDTAAVDSELTLLYSDMRGPHHALPGGIRNAFYGSNEPFSHARFPIYLVTRLAGYDFADVKGIIDRALTARNTGKFVIDLRADNNTPGNQWLREAAAQLPKDRVVLDETASVLLNERDVIAYAAWGSNDPDRKQRMLGFTWLPGAIMTEFVSTNGRTFQRPPDDWNISDWTQKALWWKGAPQTLTADYIMEGATGASGHVAEPYLQFTPHPDLLLPAYFSGRNLAESYYLSIPLLSWQNIVIGDPLCSLGRP